MQKKIIGVAAAALAFLSAFGTIVGVVGFFTGNETLPDFLGRNDVEVVAPEPGRVIINQVVCEDGMPIRLQTGMMAEVSVTDARLLDEAAGKGSKHILRDLNQFEPLTVQGGPLCADDEAWWDVSTVNGERGWVRENDGNAYLITPVN